MAVPGRSRDGGPSGLATGDLAALWREYRETRDFGLRNRLVLQNLGLVYRIANQYAALAPDAREDLVQEGCVALIRAVERFRPEYGLQFSTYAYPVISGMIKNYLRQRRRLLGHISWETAQDIAGAGEGPDVAESLVSPADLEGFAASSPRDFTDRVVERILTEALLGKLSSRERELLRQMFYEDLTQREIAHQFARSASRVSRLIRRALTRIRALLLDVQKEERLLTASADDASAEVVPSVVDEETGLFGPAHLFRCVSREIRRAQAYHGPLTLALVRPDLSAAPSPAAALSLAAERVYKLVRVLDHIFRAGPGELALMFPLDAKQAFQVCDRVVGSVSDLPLAFATASFPDDADSPAALLEAARRRAGLE